jgi:branched-chain amino acid transport system permease protein
MDYAANLVAQGLINGAVYALIAVGLTMIFGLLRILHVAHASVYTLGAYIAVGIFTVTGSVSLAALGAALGCGVVGVAIYLLFYRRLLNRPPEVVLIASIGLFIAMQEAFRIFLGVSGVSYAPVPLQQTYTIAGITVSAAQLTMLVVTVAIFILLGIFAKGTRFGVACRATVSDPQMAFSFGVSVTQVRVFTFFVGSALAGIAGTFSGILDNFIEPTMGAIPLYKAMAIIIIGGFGDVRGTLIAAILIGVVEAFGTVYLTHFLDRDAIAFATLLLILMVRPKGLFEG